MNIHLSPLNESELNRLLHQRAQHSRHTLTGDPARADLILLAGSFGTDPDLLLRHPLYLQYPDLCAVYTEDDNYLPLIPGVYCSAEIDRHSRAGRTFSYSYVSRSGQFSNPFVGAAAVPSERPLLFSFQGGSTSLLRKRLFNLDFGRPDVLIENTSTYYHWDLSQPGREDRQQRYAETLAASHFVLCPRGAGTGSIRLFEVMSAGVAPVLISDNYLLPPGPDWNRFLIRIPEKDIARLPVLLKPYIDSSPERGRLAHAGLAAALLSRARVRRHRRQLLRRASPPPTVRSRLPQTPGPDHRPRPSPPRYTSLRPIRDSEAPQNPSSEISLSDEPLEQLPPRNTASAGPDQLSL